MNEIKVIEKDVISMMEYLNNQTLEKVRLKDTVFIGDSAFLNCTNLKYIDLGEKLDRIPDHAFACCAALEEIIIPNTLSYIGERAFAGCKNLKNVTIPADCYISDHAFPEETIISHF